MRGKVKSSPTAYQKDQQRTIKHISRALTPLRLTRAIFPNSSITQAISWTTIDPSGTQLASTYNNMDLLTGNMEGRTRLNLSLRFFNRNNIIVTFGFHNADFGVSGPANKGPVLDNSELQSIWLHRSRKYKFISTGQKSCCTTFVNKSFHTGILFG